MRPNRLGVKHQLAARGSRPMTRLVSFRFGWATAWCRACVLTVGSLPLFPVYHAVHTSSFLDAAHSQALSAGTDSISGAAAVESVPFRGEVHTLLQLDLSKAFSIAFLCESTGQILARGLVCLRALA